MIHGVLSECGQCKDVMNAAEAEELKHRVLFAAEVVKRLKKKNALIAKERGKVLNVRLAMQPEKLTAQNAREPKKQYVRFAKEPVK